MLGQVLTETAVLKRLRRECVEAGSQAAYAKRCGVSHSYIRRVLCGDRAPPPAVLKRLGVKRVYVQIIKARSGDEGTTTIRPRAASNEKQPNPTPNRDEP